MAKILGPGPFPRRPSGFLRYGALAFLVITAFWMFRQNSSSLVRPDPSLLLNRPVLESGNPSSSDTGKQQPTAAGTQTSHTQSPESSPDKQDTAERPGAAKAAATTVSKGHHPIDKLIYDAQHRFAAITAGESRTVEQAAQAYRKRRGRHPPPHFDKWFEYAQSHHAVMVEEFFDQIYDDLEPFWGVDPAPMRREASQFEMTINVRNGVASAASDWMWTKIWLNMTKTIEHLLPDMDIALNAMDEPRLVVPWEEINAHMKNASKTLKLPKSKMVKNEFKPWPAPNTEHLAGDIQNKDWEDDHVFWKIVRRGCPPNSPARTTKLQTSFEEPPQISNKYAEAHLYNGYVSNYTKSVQVCHQPDLQGLEGILIHPLSTKSTKAFFPMFGGSKLTVNNEILLPAPMYWNEEERFGGGDDHGIPWALKKNKVIWRGVATGGKNYPDNWRGFQRHRFVAMNNGTKVGRVESGADRPENFALPVDEYGVSAKKEGRLGPWIDDFADVAFVDLMCTPAQGNRCNYTDFYFHPEEGLKMAQQYDNKYLPDIDGNSFSGRYLGFLRSTSLPIKATIWREWHDSRLVPWKHFVPMDSRYGDYYGIMEYFLGYKGHNAHDEAAEKIAVEGKEWAEKVLRKEDMLIYVYRLLLEYARVLDDERQHMGWVDDVIKNPSLEKSWSLWW
ncbi:uncharacterized protein UV8b_05147 [Ustilaginoidea virens]|uniref:Glycosyl transferase CAP10 domain-containing protein n=1 Tax=Ustilaginoidea virens TaxID=1159556 RepID=A0A063C9X3_USTVR|nr:uncharacterized protein UV8b_05147 [Ustilaginoidea virens]QUC20906.1 hypothetical protein UV8b_05147 [Ustilaginoidea virens]GAO19209.1 hypothetical protein UVI_02008020 [Ustilaginoidea virens]